MVMAARVAGTDSGRRQTVSRISGAKALPMAAHANKTREKISWLPYRAAPTAPTLRNSTTTRERDSRLHEPARPSSRSCVMEDARDQELTIGR